MSEREELIREMTARMKAASIIASQLASGQVEEYHRLGCAKAIGILINDEIYNLGIVDALR